MSLYLRHIHPARHGQEESPCRITRREDLGRAEHGREQTLDFLTAAARHEEDRKIVHANAEVLPCLLCSHLRVHRVNQRIADKGDVRPGRLIGRKLVREDGDDLVRNPGAGLCTSLAPRPRRRRNIRKNGDSPLFRPRREPPVKVRIVDDDEHIRPLLLHEPRKVIEEGKDAAQIQQHRRDPHDVVVCIVLTEDNARRCHLRTAKPNQGDGGVERTQFTRERRPVEIARGLPRRKHDFQVGKTSFILERVDAPSVSTSMVHCP